MDTPDIDVAVLFVQYLEGRMVEPTNIEVRLAALPTPGCPEVGEGGAPTNCLIFRNGRTTIIPATSDTLYKMKLSPCTNQNLTTQHALMMTRALATLHAHAASGLAARRDSSVIIGAEMEAMLPYTRCPASSGEQKCKMGEVEECNGECGDVLTSEVTQVDVALANLSVLTHWLETNEQYSHIVRHLGNLETDLATLMDFIQFSSAVCKKWIPSVGPISACDLWTSEDDNDDVIVIRLRGGTALRSPPLRDAAWAWLTLIEPSTLRERYTELCEEYCIAFNTAYHRLTSEADQPVQEIVSYFDVMRDLGESFLHAFFTLLHKFIMSETWYLDREMYEDTGKARIAAILEFLIDNGIVGSIFVA